MSRIPCPNSQISEVEMEKTTGTITDVLGREVTARGEKTLVYDVTVDTPEGIRQFSTFDKDVAGNAQKLKGSSVSLGYIVKQNGKYQNRTLLEVYAASATNGEPTIPVASSNGNTEPADKQASIERQNARSAAARIVAAAIYREDLSYADAGEAIRNLTAEILGQDVPTW